MPTHNSPLKPLRTLAAWAMLAGMFIGLGVLGTGCGGSTPTPTAADSAAPTTTPPPPPPPPTTSSSQEPTAADVAAARPKLAVDPFTRPGMKDGIAVATSTPDATATGKPSKTPRGGPIAIASPTAVPTPKVPPTPPTVSAVGIFRSNHGPEAILSGKDGTFIVTTGVRLQEGGYVKSIDPVSRKVVIDKENTDFVLPLEAPAGGPGGKATSPPSAPGK